MAGICLICVESTLMEKSYPENKPNPYFIIHEIGDHQSVFDLWIKTFLIRFSLV